MSCGLTIVNAVSYPTDELSHDVEATPKAWLTASTERPPTNDGSNGSSKPLDPLMANLATALHTTLDAEQMLSIFSAYTRERIPHSGLRFAPQRSRFALRVGDDGPARWETSIVVEEELLGQLSVCVHAELSSWESDELHRLSKGIRYPLRNALLHRRAVQAVHRDPLTGTSNRAALELDMHRESRSMPDSTAVAAALVLDVDEFKTINDRHGHASGDAVLRAIAKRVHECIRATDRLYRYGGDEFVVLAAGTDGAGARQLAERIRGAVDDLTLAAIDPNTQVTISVGVTLVRDGDDGYTLFDRADRALYAAKRGGRNRVVMV